MSNPLALKGTKKFDGKVIIFMCIVIERQYGLFKVQLDQSLIDLKVLL